jgi:hypothetical protein
MTSLRDQWVNQCWQLAREKADLYSGCRKILRQISFPLILDYGLKVSDAGYTKSKMTMLTKNYLHVESRDTAVQLWDKRLGQAKYGSVSFTTFNHLIKGGSIDAKRSKRASVFGPCIQSVVITWIKKNQIEIDVFYRTTELFKKFAPDVVFLRDVLLEPFDLPPLERVPVNFHFANVTIHPMYAVTTFPHLLHPIDELNRLRKIDKYFYDWVIKWSARYICPEYFRGIAKFSQAVRVQQDAMSRIPKRTLKELQKYVRNNHPGYRNTYEDPEEEGEG